MSAVVKPKSHYNFKKDLPAAKACERQVALHLEEVLGFKWIDRDNLLREKKSDYDTRHLTPNGKKQITIETKQDLRCEETGNVGVEYHCRGAPSGISITKADFYMYKVWEPSGAIGLYVAKTEVVKQMIRDKLWCRWVNGGDPGSNSLNYLFTLEVFQQHFKRIGILDH
jgi:hypothetical protein